MEADNLKFINLVHLEGDDRHDDVQAFLIARKAISADDTLKYGSVDIFVFDYIGPTEIEKIENEDGLTFKATLPDTMLSFEFDYHHGGDILHGKHNCSMTDLIRFEKVYKRMNRYNRRKETPCQRNNG